MPRTIQVLTLLLLPCVAAAAPEKTEKPKPVPPVSVTQVVQQVQKVYEGTASLRARFVQVLEGAMGKRQAEGEMLLKKPGKMRWDYSKPEKKLFVADGTTLWVYEPEDEQAFKQPLSGSQLPAQVSFLFGKGRLADEFDITAPEKDSERAGLGGPGDIVLKLVPRVPTAQYRYLAFVVDPRSYLVKETVVYDQQGGSNHLRFSKIELNVKSGVEDRLFQFTPPAGTRVIDAAGK